MESRALLDRELRAYREHDLGADFDDDCRRGWAEGPFLEPCGEGFFVPPDMDFGDYLEARNALEPDRGEWMDYCDGGERWAAWALRSLLDAGLPREDAWRAYADHARACGAGCVIALEDVEALGVE